MAFIVASQVLNTACAVQVAPIPCVCVRYTSAALAQVLRVYIDLARRKAWFASSKEQNAILTPGRTRAGSWLNRPLHARWLDYDRPEVVSQKFAGLKYCGDPVLKWDPHYCTGRIEGMILPGNGNYRQVIPRR